MAAIDPCAKVNRMLMPVICAKVLLQHISKIIHNSVRPSQKTHHNPATKFSQSIFMEKMPVYRDNRMEHLSAHSRKMKLLSHAILLQRSLRFKTLNFRLPQLGSRRGQYLVSGNILVCREQVAMGRWDNWVVF
jgi:hypothetical protein